MSSILFKGYDDQTQGAQYALPDRSDHTSIHMVGFVDDSNAQHNQFLRNQPVPVDELLTQVKHDITHGSRCYALLAVVSNSPNVTCWTGDSPWRGVRY